MTHHRRRVSLHTRVARGALAVAVLLVLFALAAAVVQTARATQLAHGDAAWIQHEPRYRDADEVHCCGPSDCRRMAEGEVDETEAGFVIKATGETIRWTAKGVYVSRDDAFWSCHRGGKTRCLFVPGRMG